MSDTLPPPTTIDKPYSSFMSAMKSQKCKIEYHGELGGYVKRREVKGHEYSGKEFIYSITIPQDDNRPDWETNIMVWSPSEVSKKPYIPLPDQQIFIITGEGEMSLTNDVDEKEAILKEIYKQMEKSGGEKKQKKFMSNFLVGEEHSPNPNELVKLVNKINLPKLFANSQISETIGNTMVVFLFENSEQAHAFALILTAKLIEKELIDITPGDEFYKNTRLESHRIDGNQFAFSEKESGDKIEAVLTLGIKNQDIKNKYSKVLQKTVKETMPGENGKIKNFNFK